MLNKAIIMGRMTRNPELRQTQSGTFVTSFAIAVDRDFKSESGEKTTDFIDIVAWRNTAEFAAKHLSKGRMVVVVGAITTRKWRDKDGNNRISVEIVADNIYFADSKPTEAADAPSDTAPKIDGYKELEDDGDLPF